MAARPRADYRYWACDLTTGRKLIQVPAKPQGPLPDQLSVVSSMQFAVDLSEYDDHRDAEGFPLIDFFGCTLPYRTLLICEREYPGEQISDIVWSGIVTYVDGGDDQYAVLAAATPGAYFQSRHVGTRTYTGQVGETDQHILTDLITSFAAPEGINILLDIEGDTVRSLRFKESSRTKLLQAIQALANLENGPEWTFRTTWADPNRLAVDLTFYARPRIGTTATNTVFDFPGAVRKYRDPLDYTEGHGANHIIGVANSRASDPVRDEAAIALGWPRVEFIAEQDGADSVPELTGLARSTLARMARGERKLSLEVDGTNAPQVYRDWVPGDSGLFVVYDRDGEGRPAPSYRHPRGHREEIRIIGFQLDTQADVLTPTLWSPYEEAV